MRFCAVAAALALVTLLTSCAPQDEATRTTNEAGGTVPWNKPASWEGPGVLGSQMSQMQGGSGGGF